MNTTDDEIVENPFGDFHSAWALEDDQIVPYIADDDTPYDIAGITSVGWVFITVMFSAVLCLSVFLCSYRHERTTHRFGDRQESKSGGKDEPKRSIDEIESWLVLNPWDAITENLKDETTRNSSASEEEESLLTAPFDNTLNESSGKAAATGTTKYDIESQYLEEIDAFSRSPSASSDGDMMIEDPAFLLLRQKPHCVLCSRFFKSSDFVSTSVDPTCSHHFHKGCIVSWLQKRVGCPVCQKPYLRDITKESVSDENDINGEDSVKIEKGASTMEKEKSDVLVNDAEKNRQDNEALSTIENSKIIELFDVTGDGATLTDCTTLDGEATTTKVLEQIAHSTDEEALVAPEAINIPEPADEATPKENKSASFTA